MKFVQLYEANLHMLHALPQVAEASLRLYAQFLNNSSSRWEAICEDWELQAELVDRVSPIYRSDFQRQACYNICNPTFKTFSVHPYCCQV